MSELAEKSMRVLELPAVLALLADQAASDAAKARCRALLPQTEAEDVVRLQEETDAARELIGLRGAPAFTGLLDVADSLARADQGGALNTRELLRVAGLLRCARRVKEYQGDGGGKKTAIDHLFWSLHGNRHLEEKIFTSILDEDEIADTASPELAEIRRLKRAAAARGRQILQRIISSPSYSKVLQESIITMRDGRFVVPVKAEHRASLPGLVHDVSSSGATLFVEPMGAVQANNELKELEAREQKEIDRILRALSADAAACRGDIQWDYDALVHLDVIFAKGQLSYRMDACRPEIARDRHLVLRRARHPLLDSGRAVPIDIELGGRFDTLVITGPNTGGKTVSLKTLGLLSLMAQCGLHVPAADGSRLPVFRRVLADIGDEQSIEQSLSTFSAHMTNIVGILKEADRDTLALFDELGAGTDPVEGAALAIAVIQSVRAAGARVAATTHYAELKTFAMTTPGVENASCEFDIETLQPTYKLLIGVPGKSNAFAISQRLGLPEAVIAAARAQMDSESVQFEDVLAQLEARRQQLEKEQGEAERLLRQREEDARRAREFRAQMEKARENARSRGEAEARRLVREAREAADEAFRELAELRKRQEKSVDWQAVNDARAGLRQRLNQAEEKLRLPREQEPIPAPSRPIRPGDLVELPGTAAAATVLSAEGGRLRLQAGAVQLTVRADQVRLIEDREEVERRRGGPRKAGAVRTPPRAAGVPSELDIRGLETLEAEDVVNRYLDAAALAHLTQVSIIHGKGTGALRKAVHQILRRHRGVKSFRLGRYGEGEDGVTVAELR